MNTIAIESWPFELPAHGGKKFPDFILNQLVLQGIGRVEADFPDDGGDVIWRYFSRSSEEAKILTQLPKQFFRPVLPRFAAFAQIDPYCGHTLFAVAPAANWPVAAVHRFSLFLCNEPTMGIWLRLYLYCIDGVWPTPADSGE